ncbi:hypothetical protein [Halomonas alimentaria]|uniref:Uncharacterized protein n=1 Tax=Halomonas alimentaria TaxID=147248 RepID=A0A7X5AP97_9GAMM|nr:hypothetical protein [Halomonas alimentaria]NAW33708.1 hypothetical protein [Halomonas alimentaria]
MNVIQSANRRQSASGRCTHLLSAGIGALFLVTAHQAAADEAEAALELALFGDQVVELLEDASLAGIRGKYVERRDELVDTVILWDERPGGSGQGGNGAGGPSGNSAQGFNNHQATRVTTQRSQSSWR